MNLKEWISVNLSVHKWRGRRKTEAQLKECIFCGKPKKLEINVDKKVFKCWSANCGAYGRVEYLIAYVEGISIREARTLLEGVDNEEYNRLPLEELSALFNRFQKRLPLDPSRFDLFIPLPKDFVPCYRKGKYRIPKALAKRKIPKRYLRDLNIGYAEIGKYGNRVIIPIKCAGMSSFVGRSVFEDEQRKYLLPPLTDTGSILFGYDLIDFLKPLILVEGVFDAIALMKLGFNAAAYLGSELQPGQAELVAKAYPSYVVVLSDPDAIIKAYESARLLVNLLPVRIGTLEGSADPDKLARTNPAKLLQVIQDAEPYRGNLTRKLGVMYQELLGGNGG